MATYFISFYDGMVSIFDFRFLVSPRKKYLADALLAMI